MSNNRSDFGLHQLLKEPFGPLAVKCSEMKTAAWTTVKPRRAADSADNSLYIYHYESHFI